MEFQSHINLEESIERRERYNESSDKCNGCHEIRPVSELKTFPGLEYQACDNCRKTESCKPELVKIFTDEGEQPPMTLIETFLND